MPGFTHLQVAQPVTFGHHLLAYVEMLNRDAERLPIAASVSTACRLAVPLAGTSYPIDRAYTAQLLVSTLCAKTRWMRYPTVISPLNSPPPPH